MILLPWNSSSGDGRNQPVNEAFRIHPPGDGGLARCDDGIALILIAKSAKNVIKLAIHLGNPDLDFCSLNTRLISRHSLRARIFAHPNFR